MANIHSPLYTPHSHFVIKDLVCSSSLCQGSYSQWEGGEAQGQPLPTLCGARLGWGRMAVGTSLRTPVGGNVKSAEEKSERTADIDDRINMICLNCKGSAG